MRTALVALTLSAQSVKTLMSALRLTMEVVNISVKTFLVVSRLNILINYQKVLFIYIGSQWICFFLSISMLLLFFEFLQRKLLKYRYLTKWQTTQYNVKTQELIKDH